MNYLNLDTKLLQYQKVLNSRVFVDKTLLIEKVNSMIRTSEKYLCITRPRRFGKTININMLAAYYSKGCDSDAIFSKLKIGTTKEYRSHLNHHDVIFIDFSKMSSFYETYQDYMQSIQEKLLQDIHEAYPKTQHLKNVITALELCGDSFIFLLDEWDSVFHFDFMKEKDKEDYMIFLRDLLKDQPYVELVYMTGVLPIAKYSSGSSLNMFREFNFLNDAVFSKYFGFTGEEVDVLCEQFHMDREEIREWYDGYRDFYGNSIYNPRSVSNALSDGVCQSYWTETGPMDEISWYISNNVEAVREDIVEMVAGNPVRIRFHEFYGVERMQLQSRSDILSAMVVYGFLTYHDGYLSIPNKELMLKFAQALQKQNMGYVYRIAMRSDEMLDATLAMDTKTMETILEKAHEEEIPLLQYNDENSLSCVITLVYLNARDTYRIEREEKSAPVGVQRRKGYADFIFHPYRMNSPAIILELKKDVTPEMAIQQIKEKNYMQKVKDCQTILLVGITYSSKDKQHHVLMEKITV